MRIFASLFSLRIYFLCIPLSFLSNFSIVRADFQNRAAYGVSHVLYIFFSNSLNSEADVDRHNLTWIHVVTICLVHMWHRLQFSWLRWNCKALPVWYAPGYFRLMCLLLRVFLVHWNTRATKEIGDVCTQATPPAEWEKGTARSLLFSLPSTFFLFDLLCPLWFIQAISKRKKSYGLG